MSVLMHREFWQHGLALLRYSKVKVPATSKYSSAENFPLLEELDIYYTSITKDDVESVDCSCPLLRSLILDDTSSYLVGSPAAGNNYKALAIANNIGSVLIGGGVSHNPIMWPH
ncbi:hypothetical protein RDI58_004420 [Solanum bulbocastanum]|uniref:Uncharacterized protein n=1 Tax=Solanum bulbocastanum TaxID=147425 RepID=A0AAN8YK38_SOLBU